MAASPIRVKDGHIALFYLLYLLVRLIRFMLEAAWIMSSTPIRQSVILCRGRRHRRHTAAGLRGKAEPRNYPAVRCVLHRRLLCCERPARLVPARLLFLRHQRRSVRSRRSVRLTQKVRQACRASDQSFPKKCAASAAHFFIRFDIPSSSSLLQRYCNLERILHSFFM